MSSLTHACNHTYHSYMRKTDAIKIFGSASELARAIGISPQAVYQWPDELSRALEDRVLAATHRAVTRSELRRAIFHRDGGAA